MARALYVALTRALPSRPRVHPSPLSMYACVRARACVCVSMPRSVACGDGAVGAFCPRQPAFWSSFYRLNGRDPTNMTLAPGVEKRLGRRMVGSAAVSARS